MKRFALVLICAATVALGTAAKDDGGMGTLAGTVVGRNGKPVAGARVTSQMQEAIILRSRPRINGDGFSFPI
jgi:hypothetical protein